MRTVRSGGRRSTASFEALPLADSVEDPDVAMKAGSPDRVEFMGS